MGFEALNDRRKLVPDAAAGGAVVNSGAGLANAALASAPARCAQIAASQIAARMTMRNDFARMAVTSNTPCRESNVQGRGGVPRSVRFALYVGLPAGGENRASLACDRV